MERGISVEQKAMDQLLCSIYSRHFDRVDGSFPMADRCQRISQPVLGTVSRLRRECTDGLRVLRTAGRYFRQHFIFPAWNVSEIHVPTHSYGVRLYRISISALVVGIRLHLLDSGCLLKEARNGCEIVSDLQLIWQPDAADSNVRLKGMCEVGSGSDHSHCKISSLPFFRCNALKIRKLRQEASTGVSITAYESKDTRGPLRRKDHRLCTIHVTSSFRLQKQTKPDVPGHERPATLKGFPGLLAMRSPPLRH